MTNFSMLNSTRSWIILEAASRTEYDTALLVPLPSMLTGVTRNVTISQPVGSIVYVNLSLFIAHLEYIMPMELTVISMQYVIDLGT